MPEFEYPVIFKGIKGQYEIIEESPTHVTVKYISGEWLGKVVKMSRQVHDTLQRNIRHDKIARSEGEKDAVAESLDLWYKKYPGLYNSLFFDGIMESRLLKLLEETYSEAGEVVRDIIAETE